MQQRRRVERGRLTHGSGRAWNEVNCSWISSWVKSGECARSVVRGSMTVLKRKTLTLVVTQSCNLNCAYCYQSHKSKQFMTMDIAKSAIDKQINNAGAYDEIEIDLFGGEAFVRPDFIIELC